MLRQGDPVELVCRVILIELSPMACPYRHDLLAWAVVLQVSGPVSG